MIEGRLGIYKRFMIVEHPEGHVVAYRSPEYYRSGITSYQTTSRDNISLMIDEAEDYGEFTDEQYAELASVSIMESGFTPEELGKVVEAMPFMPEKGEPLPEYIAKELYPSPTLELMEVPVSDSGRVVADETARLLKEFMQGGSFELKNKFEESGWSSEDIIYTGDLTYTPTGTQYLTEINVFFEWRDPIKDVSRTITLFEERLGGPEDIWGGDLSYQGGQAAKEALSR